MKKTYQNPKPQTIMEIQFEIGFISPDVKGQDQLSCYKL